MSAPPSFTSRMPARNVLSVPHWQWTEREIAAHQRARDAAADRLADHEHLIHGDFERI